MTIFRYLRIVPMLLIVLLAANGCDILIEQKADAGNQASIDLKQVYEEYEEDDCIDNCATIKLKKISISSSTRINSEIDQILSMKLNEYVRNRNKKEIRPITEEFFKDFKAFKEAFPESTTPWEISITMDASVLPSTGIVSISTITYAYTGGAHPEEYRTFDNFSFEGKRLAIKQIIKDERGFLSLAEEAFRKAKGIASGSTLSAAGFEFEKDEFTLPEQIGFNDNSVLIHFNPYEINSYADGATTLSIPMSQVSSMMQ
ncbi:MAG: hypothetical protein ACI9RP_001204 [Cyclobacteriaceae bacterium]|jgi:hypothetical protein